MGEIDGIARLAMVAVVGLLLFAIACLTTSLLMAHQQLRSLRQQLGLLTEMDEVSRSRAVAEGFYDNVLEADVTHDRLIGANAINLLRLLEISVEIPFSSCIQIVLERFIKEEYRAIYSNAFDRETLLRRFNQGERKFSFEFEECADLVHYCWTRVTVCLYYSELSRSVRLISYVKNIQAEKERELRLLRAAATDALTGILNRRETERLANEILQGGGTHGLLIIDIDNFKQINDSYGHACGDEVLRLVGRVIQSIFRQEDVVGRIGGDEFLVLLRDCQNPQNVAERAAEIVSRVAQLHRESGVPTPVSLSVGVSVYPTDGMVYEKLFAAADEALYQVKENGRNDWKLYQPATQKKTK